MKKCMQYFQYLTKCFVAGIISILILSFFTLFYNFSGVHIDNKNGVTDYTWEPNQFRSNMTEGYSWMKWDKNGYNNSYPNIDNRPVEILLMGSSHMEAVNVKSNENVAYLLNEKYNKYYTYNIGISGHTIYNCINNIKYASDYYKDSKYIIIETDTIELSIETMNQVINNKYEKIPSYDSGILYYIQKNVPAAKVIYKKLDEWKSVDDKNIEKKENVNITEYNNVLDSFIKKASETIYETDKKIIIFYNPSIKLDKKGNFENITNQKYLEQFKYACQNNNIIFIDMTESFERLYLEENVLPRGFSNIATGVGHLNKYGHNEIAKKLIETIEMEENKNDAK